MAGIVNHVNIVFLFLAKPGSPLVHLFLSLRNREITRKRIVLPEVNSLCLLNALGRRGHEDSRLLLNPEGFGLVVKTKKKDLAFGDGN